MSESVSARSVVTELRDNRELIWSLASRDLKSTYRSSTFGHLWSLANPLTIMVVYTVVFSFIMRIDPPPGKESGLDSYALWLLCGLLPWLFFTKNVNAGILSLIGNSSLIKKVAISRVSLVISSSVSALVTWMIEMSVLLVGLLIAGAQFWVHLPSVVLFATLLWLFAAGTAMIFSIVNVYWRDTQHLVTVLLQVWFFATPILYPLLLVEAQSQKMGEFFGFLTVFRLYMLNPMAEFALAFRSLLYDNVFPPLYCTVLCLVWGVGMFVIGLWVFKRYENRLAEEL